jgi:transmembrane sensor
VNRETADLVLLPSPKPLSAEEWAVRLREKPVTPEDRASFEAWISDPAHREEMAQCRGLEVMASALKANPGAAYDLFARAQTLRGDAPRRRFPGLAMALAASTVAAIVALTLLMPSHVELNGEDVTTRRGEQRALTLEDGSTVQINTDSAVAFGFTATERRVELKRGEAFFDVKRDPARPFVVKVGKSEVQVVGTQFSVRHAADRVEVVVKEGRVSVVPDTGPLAMIMPKVELTPGNRLRLDPTNRLKVASVDVNEAIAWRNGSIAFDNITLDEVVAEVNRYTDKPLRIDDARLKSHLISGRVRVGDVETLLSILKEQFGIESASREGQIVLTARP